MGLVWQACLVDRHIVVQRTVIRVFRKVSRKDDLERRAGGLGFVLIGYKNLPITGYHLKGVILIIG